MIVRDVVASIRAERTADVTPARTARTVRDGDSAGSVEQSG
jgi:hypothetical protein